MSLKWNVLNHEWNTDKITVYNVFDHCGFHKDVTKLAREYNDKEEFAKHLKSDLMYHFWSRCEYEIIVAPWIPKRNNSGRKIDIYYQVMLNWDKFVDYVWSNKSNL